MNETIDNLLIFFKKRLVSIQITLDFSEKPTVHAIYEGDIHKTDGTTVLCCLQAMREKLFGI